MGNIINLIKLHYDSVIALKKQNLMVIIAVLLILIFNKDGGMIPFATGMILMILNYNSLAYEDRSKSEYLIYSLPVKSKDYILSRYLFGISNIIITIVLADIICIALKVLNIMSMDGIAFSEVNVSSVVIGVVIVSMVVPIALIAGFNKARIIIICLAVFPICFSSIISSYISRNSIMIQKFNDSFYVSDGTIIVTAIIVTLISYFITSTLYCKKDIRN